MLRCDLDLTFNLTIVTLTFKILSGLNLRTQLSLNHPLALSVVFDLFVSLDTGIGLTVLVLLCLG